STSGPRFDPLGCSMTPTCVSANATARSSSGDGAVLFSGIVSGPNRAAHERGPSSPSTTSGRPCTSVKRAWKSLTAFSVVLSKTPSRATGPQPSALSCVWISRISDLPVLPNRITRPGYMGAAIEVLLFRLGRDAVARGDGAGRGRSSTSRPGERATARYGGIRRERSEKPGSVRAGLGDVDTRLRSADNRGVPASRATGDAVLTDQTEMREE